MAAQIIELRLNGASLDQIARLLRDGGVAIFPTDTIYGIGGNALNPEIVARVHRIKGRPSGKPFSLHLADVEDVHRYCQGLTSRQTGYLNKLLPGRYTVVLSASDAVPDAFVSDGKVGIRVPDSAGFRAIAERLEFPLFGTSVNRSGEPPLTEIDEIAARFSDEVDMIVVTDEPMTNESSVVIDLTRDPPVALRGDLPQELLGP
ncbi:MAG: L-threonylcarbamoyladenylate synthase [Candidatus Bipolaricaulia bacterium]